MPSPKNWPALHALATSLAWVRIAIFGVPVVPPVQKNEERSCGSITRPLTSRSVGLAADALGEVVHGDPAAHGGNAGLPSQSSFLAPLQKPGSPALDARHVVREVDQDQMPQVGTSPRTGCSFDHRSTPGKGASVTSTFASPALSSSAIAAGSSSGLMA